MITFLIIYYCFSSLFSIGTVDETEYETNAGAIMAVIVSAIIGPILFPVMLGILVKKWIKQ